MDRPAGSLAADEHWAPDHLVLDRRVLTYAGRLFVEQDANGEVIVHAPLVGMAAVEQRYPAWALGPFGRIEPEQELPEEPGVFALVTQGVVSYVGASRDLARSFGPRNGLGHISRRDCQRAGSEERCRLNRLVTAEAKAGRTVDVYVLVTPAGGLLSRLLRRGSDASADQVAEQLRAAAHGPWHLPT
ncbi:hypothetical protein [Actinotalea subterranea]|uniref:hypothetical protein n=1 Tax=Actinotalea subterranea TaxID=2607497 RepID=UPI0011EE28AA|nr:hypothetical protein [Actinotalea subterranea]